jgi:hypothetical protein
VVETALSGKLVGPVLGFSLCEQEYMKMNVKAISSGKGAAVKEPEHSR